MRQRKAKVLWIADNEEKLADTLSYEFIFYDGEPNFWHNLTSKINGIKPQLIIIDHKLDKPHNSYLPKQGLSIAQFIREKAPNCPIIGYSADPDIVDSLKSLYEIESVYDDIFLLRDLAKKPEQLNILARDFDLVRKKAKTIKSLNDIMNLIKAPEEDRSLLEKALPDSILTTIHGRNQIQILLLTGWIRKRLMSFPGFLYDSLEAATHVGLTNKAFLREPIKKIFENALYKGVFVKSCAKPLWWASTLRKITFSRFQKNNIAETGTFRSWLAGRYLKRGLIKKPDLPRCFKCGKIYPEIVGYSELTNEIRVPLHLACSEPHPYKKRFPFFEEIRIKTDNY